ncbi:MAG: glycosyltransferase family 4 protein [Thermoplasmatota archaeon]
MKVLQLCTRFPPAPGGVETHVLELSRRLRARGHDALVFTSELYSETPFLRLGEWSAREALGPGGGAPPGTAPAPSWGNVEGVPVRRFRAWTAGGEAHYPVYPGMALAALGAEADVIHAHSYGYFQTNLIPIIKKLRRVPTVLTAHFHPRWSTWGGERRRGLRDIYDSTLGPLVLNAADIVIAHTRSEVRLMREAGLDPSGDRVRVVPAGVDLARFEREPDGSPFRRAFGLGEEGPLVLYAGRLAVNKGLLVLAEAAALVLRVLPDARFAVVGRDMGAGPPLLRRLRELGIESSFTLTGHIESDDIYRSAFGACDAFVLPSEYEAFGLVLLEAMASSRPVIATRVGGVPEVLGLEGVDGSGDGGALGASSGPVVRAPCGLMVEYGDAGALASAMLLLLGDRALRERMGAAGRERVRESFSWDRVADRVLEIYRELI